MERGRSLQLVFLTVLLIAAAFLAFPPTASAQDPPATVAILPIFDTVSEVGSKDFSEADLQTEMTRLRAQIGENQGRVKVGFSHVYQSETSLRTHCRIAKANNLSVGVIIAVQTHTGSFGYPLLVDKDFRRMQWRLDGTTWQGEVTVDQNGKPTLDARDWRVPTPSRYCGAIHNAALAEVRNDARQIRQVMSDYPDVIVAVNAVIEEELATKGEVSDGLLADYSPYAVTEYRDWLRHTGLYDDTRGKYAGQGAPPQIVGHFIRLHGALRSQFYDDPTPSLAAQNGRSFTRQSFNQWFGTHFSTWTLRSWDLTKFPAPITDKNFTPSPWSGYGFTAGGFDAPRKRDPSDRYWNAWSWDVPDHGGQYPPGNPAQPAFGFRQFEVKHFVSDVLDETAHAGIPTSLLYAHQIPAEEVSATRVRSGADPIWTGRYELTGSLGITRFGPIDASKVTPYSSNWGIFEWHPLPNAKPDDPALYAAAMSELNAYVSAGAHIFFPGWWHQAGKMDPTFPLSDSRFAAALHDWIVSHK